MSCLICETKSPEILEAIRTAYFDEGASAEELSIEHSIPYDLMVDHVSKCIKTVEGKTVGAMKDRSDDLQEAYERLKEAVEVAHNEYQAEPKASNAQGYSQLVQQFRGMLLDIQNLDSPEKIASELANDVVGPLVARIITTITEEFRRTREDITQKVGPDYSKVVSNVFNDSLKRVGSRLALDQQEAVIKIQKRFNLDDNALPNKKSKKESAILH